MTHSDRFRKLALALLTEGQGIKGEAWHHLHELLQEFGGSNDILKDIDYNPDTKYWSLSQDWANA